MEAIASLLSPYTIVGVLGTAVFLLAAFLDFDLFDFGSGSFSLMSIAAGLLAFAGGGFVAESVGASRALSVVLGIIFALLVVVAVAIFINKLRKSAGPVETRSYVGVPGTARTAVTKSGGQVELESSNELGPRLAFADTDTPIPAATRVIVVQDNGGSVVVEPIK